MPYHPESEANPVCRGLSAALQPGLVAAGQVCGFEQAEILQRSGGEAGRIPFVTHEDHDLVSVADLWYVVRAARIESPFQDFAIDDKRFGQVAVAAALELGPDIDHQSPALGHPRQILGLDANEARSGPLQRGIDGGRLIRDRDVYRTCRAGLGSADRR
jgi:hypothetical protein